MEKRKLADVDHEVRELANFMQDVYRRLNKLEAADTPGVNATVSLDLWPPKDWLRLSVSPWEPGRYFQLAVGPLRLDIFE